MTPSAEMLIKELNLVKHCEGGYFHQTYKSQGSLTNPEGCKRHIITSIYYLLTKDSHLSYFAQNKSDLILYYHLGDPVKIIFLNENGDISEKILGPNIQAGHRPQIVCPANSCKAYQLMGDDYALVGEAVAPGFEYEDMSMPTLAELEKKFPHRVDQFKQYVCP